MKCFCNSDCCKNSLILLARITVAVIFIKAGWGKLADMETTIMMFDEMLNYPAPALFAWLAAIAELVCGVTVLLGIYTFLSSMILGVIMLVALLTVHLGNPDGLASPMMQLTIALLGSCAALMVTGGGKYAVTKKDCPCPAKK
jgi:putative oxidoreductase